MQKKEVEIYDPRVEFSFCSFSTDIKKIEKQ